MGIDCEIAFELKDPNKGLEDLSIDQMGRDFRIEEGSSYVPGAHYSVYTLSRYYGPGYERGPGHAICAVLMQLLAHENVKTVWYGGDGSDTIPPIDEEGVLDLARHYMTFGHRPYWKYGK